MFETRPRGRARVRNGHTLHAEATTRSAWPLDQWAGLRCRREDDLGPSFHRDAEGGCTGSIKSASRSPSPLDDEQPLGSWPPRQGRRASIDRPHSTTTSTRRGASPLEKCPKSATFPEARVARREDLWWGVRERERERGGGQAARRGEEGGRAEGG